MTGKRIAFTLCLFVVAFTTTSADAKPKESGSLYTSYFVKDCEPALRNINIGGDWVGFIGLVSTGKRGRTIGGFTSEIQSGPTLGDVIGDILFGSGYHEFNDVQSKWTLRGGTLIEDHNAVLIRPVRFWVSPVAKYVVSG